MHAIDLSVDVTDAVGLGEPAFLAVTVHLPDPADLVAEPIVCFAKPGGGYSRRYYTTDLPGPGRGAQAPWHAERGWVFVSVDHLGTGESSQHDQAVLTTETLIAATQAAEVEILARLRLRRIREGFPAVENPVVLGIGQSLGGYLTIRQHAEYGLYDGMAALGYSAIHTRLDTPSESGSKPFEPPWLAETDEARRQQDVQTAELAWGFFYADTDPRLVWDEMSDFPTRNGRLQIWSSATMPLAAVGEAMTPGVAAPAAARISTPVLVASAERDVVLDLHAEPTAYPLSRSIELFWCPRMGHMHNFAGTRQQLWARIENWSHTVRDITLDERGASSDPHASPQTSAASA